MKVYGLTGNIGSGKSTVAALLRARGAAVIDADLVAREVVEPGKPALEEIGRSWPEVLRKDGTLDRKVLGQRVFADANARAELNAIVHPRIAEEVSHKLDNLRREGRRYAIYEAALIVENGLHSGLDGLIVVTAPRKLQLERLMRRDGSTQAEALARIDSQLAPEEKVALATHVLDNAGDPRALEAQVDALVRRLEEAAG